MWETDQYFIVTNNPRIGELHLKKNFELTFIPGGVKAVLAHCSRLLLEDNVMLVTDIMGGRRARAFPYLTVFLKKKTGNEDNGKDWSRIIDYQILDEMRRETYLAYDDTLNEDFSTLDQSLSETVIKNLNGIQYQEKGSRMIYDVIIIGAGPAGLAAGLYAGRARLSTLIIEKTKVGGQIVQTAEIENYPGGLEEESGASLVGRMAVQAEKFGAERVSDTVIDIELEGTVKTVQCQKEAYRAKTVIIAAGAHPVPIGCPGEKEFIGKGVSYCATCDGAFFEGFEVYVVGGGDSAVEEAIYLTRFARQVTIIHRRDQLRAAKSIQEKAFANPKLNFLWDSVVKELNGDGLLESMTVENVKTGEIKEIKADEEDGTFGVFVFIGFKPMSELFEGKVEMANGYIKTDEDMKTNLPGVFAAGDIRVKSLRQVATAVSDGAIAAVQAGKYIEEHKELEDWK